MKCPNCSETLVMSERQGVEIDYCPHCRGVWLDKGELDKLIERSAGYSGGSQERAESRPHYPEQDGYHGDPSYKHKKKKGFLGDFFDFD